MFFKHSKKAAFTLFELVLVILLSGILLSIAIPKFSGYSKNTCMKKIQLQMLQLRLNLKEQKQQGSINWDALYAPLDFKTQNCHFDKAKNGISANIYGSMVHFVLKNNILECQHTKSAKLHNGESLCDVL